MSSFLVGNHSVSVHILFISFTLWWHGRRFCKRERETASMRNGIRVRGSAIDRIMSFHSHCSAFQSDFIDSVVELFRRFTHEQFNGLNVKRPIKKGRAIMMWAHFSSSSAAQFLAFALSAHWRGKGCDVRHSYWLSLLFILAINIQAQRKSVEMAQTGGKTRDNKVSVFVFFSSRKRKKKRIYLSNVCGRCFHYVGKMPRHSQHDCVWNKANRK